MNIAAYGPGISPMLLASLLTEIWNSKFPGRQIPQTITSARTAIRIQREISLRRRRMHCAYRSDTWGELSNGEQKFSTRMTVGVFWDLDNKPPVLVPPYDAAMRLRNLASELGEIVEIVAYANRNAFTYVPRWVREQRQERRLLDQLEIKKLVKVERHYFCKLCGRTWRTNIALKGHFKQVHERERKQKLAFLKTLRGKRRARFVSKIAEEEVKYKEAARRLLIPKSGYGLGSELKRAGVDVRTVESIPQAADEALKKHITLCINKGVECICLISDDSDFLGILKTAKRKGLKVVVVGDAFTLQIAADISFSWEEVASGRYFHKAAMRRWVDHNASRAEAFCPDEDNDHFNADDDYNHDERGFFDNVDSAIRASHGYMDKGTFVQDLENGEYMEYEDGPFFSDSDDEEYLVNPRWALPS